MPISRNYVFDPVLFGDAMKRRREHLGYSRDSLCRLVEINSSGFSDGDLLCNEGSECRPVKISKDTLRNWENGEASPSLPTFLAVCAQMCEMPDDGYLNTGDYLVKFVSELILESMPRTIVGAGGFVLAASKAAGERVRSGLSSSLEEFLCCRGNLMRSINEAKGAEEIGEAATCFAHAWVALLKARETANLLAEIGGVEPIDMRDDKETFGDLENRAIKAIEAENKEKAEVIRNEIESLLATENEANQANNPR